MRLRSRAQPQGSGFKALTALTRRGRTNAHPVRSHRTGGLIPDYRRLPLQDLVDRLGLNRGLIRARDVCSQLYQQPTFQNGWGERIRTSSLLINSQAHEPFVLHPNQNPFFLYRVRVHALHNMPHRTASTNIRITRIYASSASIG